MANPSFPGSVSMQEIKDPFRVVVTSDRISPEAVEVLSEKCRVDYTGSYAKPADIARVVSDSRADGMIVRTSKVTREAIHASPRLRVIAKHGIGVDNIDVAAATELKIPVLISASANFRSVAEHALALMLSLAKDIPKLDTRVRQGHWDKTSYRGVELYGKGLGLVGFGRIGRRLAELAAPFGMHVTVFDPFLAGEVPPGITRVREIGALLKAVDIVSLHLPLSAQTRHLIGAAELGMMKKTAWLINTARGEVIDQNALIEALEGGIIAAAGLDTFAQEPPENLDRLCGAGKLVLTPHVGAATAESIVRMAVEAARNVLTVLEGKRPERGVMVNPEIYD
jgi:D-3-phosphoglycerate dehydrogenase / 2-oxoglutarate reductase